jgi:hypothetical protein
MSAIAKQALFEKLCHRNFIRREIGGRPIDIPTAYARKVKLMEEARYLEMLDPYLTAAFGSATWPTGFTPRLLLGVRLHKQAIAHLQRDHGISDPRTRNPDMLKMIERRAPAVDGTTLVKSKYVRP